SPGRTAPRKPYKPPRAPSQNLGGQGDWTTGKKPCKASPTEHGPEVGAPRKGAPQRKPALLENSIVCLVPTDEAVRKVLEGRPSIHGSLPPRILFVGTSPFGGRRLRVGQVRDLPGSGACISHVPPESTA